MKEQTTEKTSTKRGRSSYSTVKLHAKWDRKRMDAEARQREHNLLSSAEKIALAKTRRGESKREIARLLAKLAKQPEYPKAVVAPVTVPVAEVKTEAKPKVKRVAKSKVVRKYRKAIPDLVGEGDRMDN